MATDTSWYKIDYERRTAEILFREGARQQLLSFSLVAVGGLGAFLGAVEEHWGPWVSPFALFCSLFFAVVVLVYLHHDIMIAYSAQYLEKAVRLADDSIPKRCLFWEQYVLARRSHKGTASLLHKGLAFARFAPILLVSAGFFVVGLWTLGILLPSGLLAVFVGLFLAGCLVAYVAITWSIIVLFGENEQLNELAYMKRKDQ